MPKSRGAQLLDFGVALGLCAAAYALAFAIYRNAFWHRVTDDTEVALNAAFPLCLGVFTALALIALASPKLRAASWTPALVWLAYAAIVNLLFSSSSPDVRLTLNGSIVLLAPLLLVQGRLQRLPGFLKRRWPQLLLAGAVTFVTLEVGLRVVYLATYSGTLDDLYRNPRLPAPGTKSSLGSMLRPSPDPKIIYELKPGLDVRFRETRVATSSDGFREDEIPLEKRQGSRRILGLGDSTMFGWGVEVDERYMDRVEKRLEAAHPDVHWETVVTAVPGYNLAMEVQVLERRGLAYDPDLIVYGHSGNDTGLPSFVQERRSVLSPTSFISLYRRLLLKRHRGVFVFERDEELRAEFREGIPERYKNLVGPGPYQDALERLGEIAEERGIPLVVLHSGGWEPPGYAPPEILHEADSTAAEAAMGDAYRLSPRDGHPSLKGHVMLADTLYRSLEEGGLLERLAAD